MAEVFQVFPVMPFADDQPWDVVLFGQLQLAILALVYSNHLAQCHSSSGFLINNHVVILFLLLSFQPASQNVQGS